MSKENEEVLGAGLEVAEVTTTSEEKVAKEKKVQTAEEAEVLVAGVAKMREIGVSAELSLVLEMVAGWNGDKTDLVAVKEAVIKEFGGSETLKNYIDGVFQTEVLAWQGIAKAIPVLNNIKSFYARRENAVSTKKAKLIQIAIAGTIYNVDSVYLDSIKDVEKEERKALILAHGATVKVEVAELF